MAEAFAESLGKIVKVANQNIALSKGLHEVTKALESAQKPLFVVLAEDCNEARYKQLIEALCKQHKVQLVKIASRMELGAMAGFGKQDASGALRNVVGCSSLAVRDVNKALLENELKVVLQN